MADGNIGSLWMSLGLRDNVSKGLENVKKQLESLDKKSILDRKSIEIFDKAISSIDTRKPESLLNIISMLESRLKQFPGLAKGLHEALSVLDVKDRSALFSNFDIRKASSYLDIVKRIDDAISKSGNLSESDSKWLAQIKSAEEYLSIITSLNKIVGQTGASGKLSNIPDVKGIRSEALNIRKELANAWGNGTWNVDSEKLTKAAQELISKVQSANNRSIETSANLTSQIENNTKALKKEEEQAKKTAEAVASIGEKKKYVAPNVQIQEKPVNTEVEKTSNTATKKLDEVREKSDKAKSSVAALRTELNEILNAFRGKASKTLGVGDAGEKGRQYVDILNQINKKKAELYSKEGGEKNAAQIDRMVTTAQNYVLLLKDIDREYDKISNMKSINPNVDDKNIKEALGLIEHFRQQLTSLEGFQFRTGVDNANVLGNYKGFWGDTRKDANNLAKGLDNTNMLSDLQNKADRANARLAETNRQIERLDRAIDKGKAKGFNTDELFTNRAALLNRKAEFERALGKDTKRLSDINYMAGLYSETARDIKLATVALEHFGNVQRKVAEQEKAVSETHKARQAVNKEILNDYNRQVKEETAYQVRQQKIADLQEKANEKRIKSANDVTLAEAKQRKIIADLDSRISNANSLYKAGANANARTGDIQAIIDELNRAKSAIQGYSGKSLLSFDYKNAVASLDELKARFNTVTKAQSSMNREAVANHKQREANVRKMAELYTNLNKQIADAEKHEFRGLELKVDISKLDKAVADARELAEMISKVNPKLMGKGGNASLEDYIGLAKNIKTALDAAVKSQRELNTEREKENKSKAAEQAKAEAQAKRDAAKAAREANAAEKQRQRELENTENRIHSVERALRVLESIYSKPTMLNLDIRELAEKIQLLKGDLESLRFISTGLNSKDFSSHLGAYRNYGAGRTVSEALEVGRAYDNANEKAERGIDIERKRQQEIAKSAAKVQADLVRGFEKANSHAGKLNSTIQDLKSLFLQGGLVFGAQQFAMSIITVGGEMEKQHIALQSILGDMQNANTLFGQIKELALNSPFTFSELNRDVKQLAAYGVEYKDLYGTTKRLADMASGLGVSFDRIALAFGQVQARGWLDGKELRQIAYAGIPLLNKLSDLYSKREGQKVSTSEIKTRISKREVSFDDVKSVFWEMTDAGGQFYNMQQTLSETLLGRYNKLKDAWEIMLAEFASGESIVGSFFKTALDGATALVQTLHTLALPVTTIFAGYALKKALGANAGSSFLENKGKIASDIQARVLQGEQISQIERQVLITKNRITSADLEQLANAKVLTATELNRLRITGRITAEQYKSARALLLQQAAIHSNKISLLRQLVTIKTSFKSLKNGLNFSSIWSSFATSGMAAIRLVGTGIKGLATTMWSAIGGLPGLVLSGITFGITYAISSYQELSSKIEQTQDELADKNKQIYEFLRDNNISITIAKGDDKEIDNMIDAYKEKIKELAPYDYRNIYMTAEEKDSHKERLKYLDEEIKRLKEANDIAASKMSNRSYYSDLSDDIEYALNALNNKQKLRIKAEAPTATQDDKNEYNREQVFKASGVPNIVKEIKKQFGDISKDKTLRQAAMQAMSALFSELKVPQDKADILRASVLQAFGIGEESDWLKEEVGTEMRNLINEVSPLIANKIKSGQKLNDAEKVKVIELMNSAKVHLKAKYPEVEETLQKMLAASKFEAVIKLVVDDGNAYTDVQNELSRRIPSVISDKKLQEKYVKRAEEYGKDNSWYEARNAAKERIDKALNNYQYALKSGVSNTAQLKEELHQEKEIARMLLHYDYDGEGKKSNKPGKTGSQKDQALENLKDRIDLYKKLYDQIKKTEELYGKGALMQLKQDEQFKAIFDDKEKYPISDYTDYKKSIEEMLHGFNANTEDRRTFVNNEHAGIQEKKRQDVANNRQDELKELEDQLQIIESQYEVYKKIYKLTGNKNGAQNVAFSGTIESDTLKKYLEKELDIAVAGDNINSGLNYTGAEVSAMSLKDVKDNYGEKSRTYAIKSKLDTENNKIKSETIDLLADIIEKNATIAQQIEDEDLAYQHQLELIEQISDPDMKARAKEGAEKSHNERRGKLEFEQFKQESDWVTIFDDLDRVSTTTIDNMASKIDDFSKRTGLSVEIVKQLREALNKLKDEQIERNPLGYIFGGVHEGNAIGDFIKTNFSKKDALGKKVAVSDEQAKKMGIGEKGGDFTRGQLEDKQTGAYNKSNKAIIALSNKMKALAGVLQPVVDLFQALGEEDSILGQITGGATNALDSAASMAGNMQTLGQTEGFGFLSAAGPYGAAAAAALSVGSSLIKAFGADYAEYNKVKVQYENLTEIWDSLISKKKEYMDIHWGKEAVSAGEEAKEMLEAEIDQTKEVAKARLSSGKSAGSHSIAVRMWSGSYKYNGKNWKDIAPEISQKYGVKFDSMEDLLNMSPETLLKIKKEYSGFWAQLDGDYKDYLEKLIDYGDQMEEIQDNITEKVTGLKFTDMVSEWGSAMAEMSNSSDALFDSIEDKLKGTIINSMIENMYDKEIKDLIKRVEERGENSEKGLNGSEYSRQEWIDSMNETKQLSDKIAATRDQLKDYYGWSDNSDSSTNTIKGITEEQADILLSYINAMRLDLSVLRGEQAKSLPELSEIAKSQLAQLDYIAQNTLRNADSAAHIESLLNSVINGQNKIRVS